MSKTSSMELETSQQEISSRRKYLIGPIFFLHLFTFSMFNTVINLYYPYHAGKELFLKESVTSKESSLCQSNENSSSTNEQIVQSVVAEYFLYASVCMGIPCLISNIFIGSISDRYGRKKLLFVPTFGLLVAKIIVVVFMYIKLSLYYFLIPSIFFSIMGDIFAVFQIALSYVSNITEGTKRRTVGIAFVELFVGMGTLLGGVFAGYLIQSVGYIWTLSIATIVKCASLVNILLLPSTIPPTKTPWSIKETIGSLKESFQFYYSRQFAGTRWKYNLSLAIFIIVNMATIGRDSVETLYILSPPFCFTPVLVGWFHATNSLMQQAIAMLLIRIFLKFFSNEFLAMFGALSGITYFVIETAAHSTLMLFLGKTFYYIVFCMIFDPLIHNGLLPARSVV